LAEVGEGKKSACDYGEAAGKKTSAGGKKKRFTLKDDYLQPVRKAGEGGRRGALGEYVGGVRYALTYGKKKSLHFDLRTS